MLEERGRAHLLGAKLGGVPGEVPVGQRHGRVDHLQRTLGPETQGRVGGVVLQPPVHAEFLAAGERQVGAERKKGRPTSVDGMWEV